MASRLIAPIHNHHGESIAYSFVRGANENRDLVVIGHGVTSDRERPWSQALSDALQVHGIASMRIAFSGNGESGGSFADSNISKEVGDLGSVLDALGDWRVSYAGQSMGAAVGVLRAASDRRIHALVSLAGMVHTAEFVTRFFGHLQPGELMLDKPQCPLSADYLADLLQINTVVGCAMEIEAPWLLVHGTADDVVPIQHSRDIHAAARGHSDLVELEGVDHAFTGAGLKAMTAAVVSWLLTKI